MDSIALLEELRCSRATTAQPPFDLWRTARRVERAGGLQLPRGTFRNYGPVTRPASSFQLAEQRPGNKRHVPRDNERRCASMQQGCVHADERASPRLAVRNARNSRQPRIRVWVIRDEQQLVGFRAKRRGNEVDDPSSGDGGEPFWEAAEARRRPTGENDAGIASVSRVRRTSPARFRLPRPSPPSPSPRGRVPSGHAPR